MGKLAEETLAELKAQGEATVLTLAGIMSRSHSDVWRDLRSLKGRVYIDRWERPIGPRGRLTAIWKPGSLKNAERPSPLTQAERDLRRTGFSRHVGNSVFAVAPSKKSNSICRVMSVLMVTQMTREELTEISGVGLTRTSAIVHMLHKEFGLIYVDHYSDPVLGKNSREVFAAQTTPFGKPDAVRPDVRSARKKARR